MSELEQLQQQLDHRPVSRLYNTRSSTDEHEIDVILTVEAPPRWTDHLHTIRFAHTASDPLDITVNGRSVSLVEFTQGVVPDHLPEAFTLQGVEVDATEDFVLGHKDEETGHWSGALAMAFKFPHERRVRICAKHAKLMWRVAGQVNLPDVEIELI